MLSAHGARCREVTQREELGSHDGNGSGEASRHATPHPPFWCACRWRAGVVGALAGAGCATGPTPTPAPRLTGTLEFWQNATGAVDGFNKFGGEFAEKHPGVNVVQTQSGDIDNKIKVAVAAGSGGPDVYLMRGNNQKQWANTGLTIDVTEFVTRDNAAAASLKASHKTLYDYYHHNGKLHGLPFDFSAIVVAYNADAIEAQGLKLPSELGDKWDWATFTDYAKRLTPGDGSKYGVEAALGVESGYYNWVVANGGNVWSADFKTCTVNTPVFQEAVEQYMALANRFAYSPPRAWTTEKNTGQPSRAALLSNGLVSMQTLGDWYFPFLDSVKGLRWDAVPMPYAPRTKKTGSIANLRGLPMPPTTQNRDLGWDFMAHLLIREVQDRIPSLMGEVPTRTDSIEQVYLNPAKLPIPKSRKLLKNALDATVPYPAHPTIPWTDVNAILNTLNDVYDGKREARNVLIEIQEKLTALLPK